MDAWKPYFMFPLAPRNKAGSIYRLWAIYPRECVEMESHADASQCQFVSRETLICGGGSRPMQDSTALRVLHSYR